MLKPLAVLLLLGSFAAAEDAPAGWKIVKDRKQLCQTAVPADWTADPGPLAVGVHSPDKKGSVIVHGLPASAQWSTTIQTAKQMMKPEKVVATPSRAGR